MLVLIACFVGATTSCGSPAPATSAADDPCANIAAGRPIPDWFPAEFQPPPGSVLLEIIDQPAPEFGRTLTWCVDRSFDDVIRDMETSFKSLSWVPTDIDTTEDRGAKRTTFYVENGTLFAVRVFGTEGQARVRLSAELPAEDVPAS